ncbi:MAG: HAD family hydrolase [Oscillospiraceae bacterium]|nr:HAD family hydrolase [Oscillospiraceae bacterium]
MENIKMIVTDLDNTLLRKDKTISEYTRSVFGKCRKARLLTVFATARPERATRQWQFDRASCDDDGVAKYIDEYLAKTSIF